MKVPPAVSAPVPFRVRGEVDLPGPELRPGPAALHLWLEDVTLVDAPAPVVARQRHPLRAGAEAAASRLAFEFEFLPRRGGHYAVRALLDLDGDARPGRGDWVSTRHYPVEPGAPAPLHLRILLQRID